MVPPNVKRVCLHRRKQELLRAFRDFAWNADEEGFKAFMSEHLDVRPGHHRYAMAMREFWNAVRCYENRRQRQWR